MVAFPALVESDRRVSVLNHFTKQAFQTYMNSQKRAGQLDRIFIDECHIILNNQSDFRRKLQAADGAVESIERADDHVDSHVAPPFGKKVVVTHVVGSRASAVVSRPNQPHQHSIPHRHGGRYPGPGRGIAVGDPTTCSTIHHRQNGGVLQFADGDGAVGRIVAMRMFSQLAMQSPRLNNFINLLQ